MQKVIVSLCLSVAVQLCALAEAPDTRIRAPDMLVGSVGAGDLHLLLDDMEARLTMTGVNDRQAPYVFATTKHGTPFAIYTACANPDGTDCRGLEFLAGIDSRRSVEDVSQISQAYAAVSVYNSDTETVHISRYVILDHGVTWANLLENAAVFEVLCEHVTEDLSEQGPQAAEDRAR
ncbi:MAG: YbjN domain-containing protein [Alphaproteobacteria bacterium]|nr:YbjN domain-containing protein [Alphaproteobacteria bacterium]